MADFTKGMTLLGINYVLKCVQVLSVHSAGRSYNCPMRMINGEWYFNFKKQMFKVADFTTELTSIFKEKN